MFTDSQLRIIEYCAEEVRRQGDSHAHVAYMVRAWSYAQNVLDDLNNWQEQPIIDLAFPHNGPKIDLEFIQEIGMLVEPQDNALGFRTVPVGVGNGIEWIEKARPDTIVRKLEMLLSAYYDGMLAPGDIVSGLKGMEDWPTYKRYKLAETAEDVFYYEFEEIHPFRDGNGRTGKILYNYLSGTLDDPIWPPNFWGVSNP